MAPEDPSLPFRPGREAAAGFFLFVLVQAGRVGLSCDSGDLSLLPGSLVLLPPALRPRFRDEAGAELASFSFAPSLLDAFVADSAMDLAIETLAATKPLLARLAGRDWSDAARLFSELCREAEQRRSGFLPMLRLKLMELLLLLGRGPAAADLAGRGLSGAAQEAAAAPARFSAASLLLLLEEGYADPISLDGLARHFGLNPAYLSRAFSKETGTTIVESLNRIRIQKSCAMLKRSKASIMEISVAVGYNNLSHFNRCFRRIMGMSPRDWRIRSQR